MKIMPAPANPPNPASKRRKVGRATEMASSSSSQSPVLTWPQDGDKLLPAEIYHFIIRYLPRSDIQNMRLVSKEFDRMVCQTLFRVVVVPFRPEIYGIHSDITGGDSPHSSVMLQDKGMRVFQGFGQWIKKFAMSFEIDPIKLANPPTKSDQEAITSFWGVYRWPFQTYNRFTQLEGLEQTADETRSMAKALRFISSARELGLSIDGGLGWLPGPDINQRVAKRNERLAVFGESAFVPEPKNTQTRAKPQPTASTITLDDRPSYTPEVERMLREVSRAQDTNLDVSVRRMLEAEDMVNPAPAQIHNTTQAAQLGGGAWVPYQVPNGWGTTRRRQRTTDITANLPMTSETEEQATLDLISEYATVTSNFKKANDMCPLKPNDLTNAQMEMLLEMEWAQNAFMQSWVIAIVDNRSTFSNIETLTIARLPRRHLPILRRGDFWNSLPQLKKLSLAVIPDWREVRKDESTWVQDDRVEPSKSVPVVWQILNEQISHRKNITKLHFEWVGGGEYAPGLMARNQHVLAAPVVSDAAYMINRAQNYPVLALPFVEHLSFKNCWFSPHIISRFTLPLKKLALHSLAFDSVSLTAFVPPHAQLHAVQLQAQGGFPQWAPFLQQLHHPVPLPVPGNNPNNAQAQNGAPNGNNNSAWFDRPRHGSWPELLDELSPLRTTADVRYEKNKGPEPEPREPSQLSKLEFTSCGYVRLPVDLDQHAISEPPGFITRSAELSKKINEIEGFMMAPLDPLLGVIVNYMARGEVLACENVWNLAFGWRHPRVNRPQLFAEACLDGYTHAGQGRFTGSIVADAPSSSGGSRRC